MAERPEDPPEKKRLERSRAEDLSAELTAAPSPGAVPAPPGSSSSIRGTTVGHFEVLELLGAGGFGEVYRARDARLGRMVAIKVLPEAFGGEPERRERFRREAMAASALNHPNICTVYELIESGEKTFIVMELIEGKTLAAVLKDGHLPLGRLLPIALQVTEALGEAHRAGILHRDIKPGNIALTTRGQVKVLDFGLAKLVGSAADAEDTTLEKLTVEGTTSGTLGYMSPEQLLGRQLDRRADLFSFGVVLYEMVTGRLPFEGSTPVSVSDAILHAAPRDFGDAPVPEKLKAVIRKLLEKDPARRYATAEEVHADLKALEASLAPAPPARLPRIAWVAVAAVAILVAAGAAWFWHRWSRQRWALETTPEIARLVAAEEYTKATALLREARVILPGDPTLGKLWGEATLEVSVETDPPDAEVSFRPYRGDPNAWEYLGKTPVTKARVPYDFFIWRIEKPGYAAAHYIAPGVSYFHRPLRMTVQLHPQESVPAGMIPVQGGETELAFSGFGSAPSVKLDDYLIDRNEVTNEAYKRFVDADGYRKREFWKQPFVRDGKIVPWEEAVAFFRDTTGRAGPATWEVGGFPKGLEKHPVAGVSWYEAAAYAEFSGKSLPTAYHWSLAAQTDFTMLIVPGSNFQDDGTISVGGPGAVSGFGTTDMAGNVKEWCWTESAGGKRFILGGGFGEPSYMFYAADGQSPWDRRPNYGFRCVKLFSSPPAAAMARLERFVRDYSKERPASDEVFKVLKGLYSYDKTALNARLEETETTEDWIREKVSFDAAYGGERVIAHLYLPTNAPPPYQVVVYFPGGGARFMDKLNTSTFWGNDFVPKSGRVFLFPVYKGTFERWEDLKREPTEMTYWRDHRIMWSKDVGRSLDYLETRKDIDREKIAYLGFSWGAIIAPIVLSVDDRFKAAILNAGGLPLEPKAFPEGERINFLPRVKIPVLMLNGRYDSGHPVESSQIPFFRLLGTPEKDKRHVICDAGHVPPRKDVIRESLDWLDKYLGPVKK
jgi:formylglycine-generating enzyme required for sulfatase activity